MVGIAVAIYKELDPRDARHWALVVIGNSNVPPTILQTGDEVSPGGKGYFIEEPMKMKPEDISLHIETIMCGDVSSEYSEDAVVDIVLKTEVNSRSNHWNCQNWVLEAIQYLESNCGLTVSADVRYCT
eukprot:IDg12336t1